MALHYDKLPIQCTEKLSPLKIGEFIFNRFGQKIDCEYTLEPPRRCDSNEYPQSMFWIKNKKIRNTLVNPSSVFLVKLHLDWERNRV